MQIVNKLNKIYDDLSNIMPLPLESLQNKMNNGYNQQKDLEYMNLLESRIAKILEQYVIKAINDEKYIGSPIYNGYIDRDTISTIVDKAIYYAEQNVGEVKDIVANYDSNYWSKNEFLRAVVQTMVLHYLFSVVRPENKDKITIDNNKNNNITPMPVEDTILPTAENLPIDELNISSYTTLMPLDEGMMSPYVTLMPIDENTMPSYTTTMSSFTTTSKMPMN